MCGLYVGSAAQGAGAGADLPGHEVPRRCLGHGGEEWAEGRGPSRSRPEVSKEPHRCSTAHRLLIDIDAFERFVRSDDEEDRGGRAVVPADDDERPAPARGLRKTLLSCRIEQACDVAEHLDSCSQFRHASCHYLMGGSVNDYKPNLKMDTWINVSDIVRPNFVDAKLANHFAFCHVRMLTSQSYEYQKLRISISENQVSVIVGSRGDEFLLATNGLNVINFSAADAVRNSGYRTFPVSHNNFFTGGWQVFYYKPNLLRLP